MISSMHQFELKNKICLNFNNAHSTYDQYGHVQSQVAKELVMTISKQREAYRSVADFACGTGECALYLLKDLMIEQLYAVDIADNLISIAKNKCQDERVRFVIADFETDFFVHNSFDLISVSMGLQWALQINQVFNCFYNYLNQDGLLAFSVPLSNSFNELPDQYRNQSFNAANIHILLEESGFNLIDSKEKTWIDRFDSPLTVLRSFKHLGANTVLHQTTKQHGLNRHHQLLKHISSHGSKLTYHVGFFIAQRMD